MDFQGLGIRPVTFLPVGEMGIHHRCSASALLGRSLGALHRFSALRWGSVADIALVRATFDEACEALAAAHLSELTLSLLSCAGVATPPSLLQCLPQLRTLSLNLPYAGNVAASSFLRSLSLGLHLKELSLTFHSDITGEAFVALQALAELPNLRSLWLCIHGAREVGGNLVSLRASLSLRELSVCLGGIVPFDGRGVGLAGAEIPNLTSLRLLLCGNLRDEGLELLCSSLGERVSRLRQLWAPGCYLTDASVPLLQRLAEAPALVGGLKCLSGNSFSPQATDALRQSGICS